jgi:hypothetical protein
MDTWIEWDRISNARQLAKGGTEVWLPYREGSNYYVSNLGQVRHGDRILNPKFNKKTGYRSYTINGKTEYPHQMVLLAFDGPPPPGMRARRESEDKVDNRLCNLYWGRGAGRISDDMVFSARQKHADGTWSTSDVARNLDTSTGYASTLLQGGARKEAGGTTGPNQPARRGEVELPLRYLAEDEDPRALSRANVEVWKPILGPGEIRYVASNLGRIYNLKTCRLLQLSPTPLGPDKRKYLTTCLSFSDGTTHHTALLHRLVLLAFDGPAPNQTDLYGMAKLIDGRHLDGNGLNCALYNLAWGTRTENVNDAVKADRHARGDRHGRAVLSEARISSGFAHLISGEIDTLGELAEFIGTDLSNLHCIMRGETWRSVPRPAGLSEAYQKAKSQSGLNHLTKEAKENLYALLDANVAHAEIARRLGLSFSHIGYYAKRRKGPGEPSPLTD